jgi:hypothetical protein
MPKPRLSDEIERLPDTWEDVLVKFLTSEGDTDKLPPKLAEKYEQITYVHNLMLKRYTRAQVKKMYMERYNSSAGTAFEMIAKCQYIFGINRRIDKDYYRSLMSEWIIQDIRLLRNKSKWREVTKLYEQLYKVLGLEKDDLDAPPAAPPPATINYQFNLQLIGAQPIPNLNQELRQILGETETDAHE